MNPRPAQALLMGAAWSAAHRRAARRRLVYLMGVYVGSLLASAAVICTALLR